MPGGGLLAIGDGVGQADATSVSSAAEAAPTRTGSRVLGWYDTGLTTVEYNSLVTSSGASR